MTIAHLNWAYLRAPWGDPEVAGFVDNVDIVNRASTRAEGFTARPELSDAMVTAHLSDLVRVHDGRVDASRLVATLSVWDSDQALWRFVHKTIHGRFLGRRAEWFVPQNAPSHVIWPIADGHLPDLGEARDRIGRLMADGPSEFAYDFRWMEAQAA